MSEPTTPAEDELVTAVLDGEATEHERAQVDADPRLRARLQEFAAIRGQLADVTRPSADERAAMIARATATPPYGDAPDASEEAAVLQLERERRHRRVLTVLTVAAVAVVVIPLLAITLVRGGSETSVDSASAPSAEDATGAAAGDASGELAPSVDAPDLGLVTSADQLRVIIGGALRASNAAGADQERMSLPTASTATTAPTPLAAGSQTVLGACAANLVTTDPTLGEPVLSATASWKGDPSFVLVFRSRGDDTGAATSVIVVTTADCTPVERITV